MEEPGGLQSTGSQRVGHDCATSLSLLLSNYGGGNEDNGDLPQKIPCRYFWGFHGSPDGKAAAYRAGDPVRTLGQEDSLEKEMTTHSSILAWKIPRTEDPGRLLSMGSQRVGHDWVTSLSELTYFLLMFFICCIK